MIDTEALRKKIIDLAIQGKLTQQLPEDGNAEDLYVQIQEEKTKLIKDGKIKKEKPLPEITDDEIPFEIPNNWKWVYLGDVFNHNTGKALNASDKTGSKMEYITTSNLYWDHFELDNLKSMYFTESELEKCTIQKGDLLICEGGDIGRSAIWPYDREMRIQNHIHKLRSYCEIEQKFYYYVLRDYKYSGLIDGRGIGLQGFSSQRVHSLVVPLPPLDEQRRIVRIIDSAYIHIDVINTLQQQYEFDREILKRKIIDAGIRGKLTEQLPEDGDAEDLYAQIQEEKAKLIKDGKLKKEKPLPEITDDEIPFDIPEDWKWVRLGNLGANVPNAFADGPFGSNLKREHYTSEKQVRIIQLSNVGIEGWKDDNEKYTTYEHLKTIQRSEVKAGDIVIAKMMPAGRSIVVPDISNAYVLSSDCVKFVPNSLLDTNYLRYAINSNIFHDQVLQDVHGIGRERTSLSNLKRYLLPIPPIEEQKRIVSIIEAMFIQLAK